MVLYPSADEIRQRQQQAAAYNRAQSMASRQTSGNQQNNSYLSPNQQDLLVAALTSQANPNNKSYPPEQNIKRSDSESHPDMATNGATLFMSPQQAEFDGLGADFTPDLDYLDGDSFDFENADLGGEMIGALPGSGGDSNGDFIDGAEYHEKRKNPDDGSGSEEGDAKRQEGEKGSKKPGRKPLTSEPTTKRKAQNRAAQRAFRERKEKHLKDLETKVSELTKSQEADRHENGLLKAQVDRLQTELRDYRKRLSLNSGSGANRSSPLSGVTNPSRSNRNSVNGNGFQFDFPKFGALPGSQIFGNQNYSNGSNTTLSNRNSATPPTAGSPVANGSFSGPTASRENSKGRSMSPTTNGASSTGSPAQANTLNPSFTSYSTNSNMHGFASTLPQMNNTGNDVFGDLFSPSILKSASMDSNSNYFSNANMNNNSLSTLENTGGDTTSGLNRVFQFNGGSSTSDSASPSASSGSHWNANNMSSTGTSPEPSHGSPMNKNNDKVSSAGQESFCDAINPLRHGSQSDSSKLTQPPMTNTLDGHFSSNPDFSVPSANTFDPVLFGDYRDSNEAMIGGAGGDFSTGFFDEALPFDYNSPSNLFGILQSPQQMNSSLGVNNVGGTGAANAPTPSRNLMAEIDKTRDGGDDDFGLANGQQKKKAEESGKFISCNNIWAQLQSNEDFQKGTFDLDGLCSELRSKARCSESGVLVDQKSVDEALRKLGKKDDSGKVDTGPHHLMFEQKSWDSVLAKLNGNRA